MTEKRGWSLAARVLIAFPAIALMAMILLLTMVDHHHSWTTASIWALVCFLCAMLPVLKGGEPC